METSTLTPREYWAQVRANPRRARFGFGQRPALLNIDLQRAYTDSDCFATAYRTDPRQLEYIEALATLARGARMPVIWTYLAYEQPEEAGVWGTRTDTPDSLQNIRDGSDRAQLDPRLGVDRKRDTVIRKRMPSAFHDTGLLALLQARGIDTLILTGGSTSGCVRATAVDGLSHGYRVIVAEECVADRHEIPHYASLCDLMLRYADVEPVASVRDRLSALPGRSR